MKHQRKCKRPRSPGPFSLRLFALVFQQPLLALQPTAILHQRAIGADQAVAGHHDADRVGAVGGTHGADGGGLADALGEVLLVAADGRIRRYRHPIPKATRLERTLMFVVCAQRKGLIVAFTRMLNFGELPADLRRRHDSVCAIDAALHAATRPGASYGAILDVAVQGGFPSLFVPGGNDAVRTDLWTLRVNLTGYLAL